ncbi:capsular polysaccharide transport system ATP-binding protein [Faunimonas pinastri]|uniref:Capsular polysaccharide transport system ATP-binding protein n=1 Tax=Faunimonas pinastri TaxID=1855383 RepID=A0A1H9FET1_9HYPH|nr:ATP-binding cassette domain-containing protein [Faunimonas pinastri]SEQ36355.1 capsular polysaccharide transport system ATP-binding protein [Faunimonas pinastri]
MRSGTLRTLVLDDVSIALPTDRRLVVLGQQGSGRSTLIQLLAGLLLPSSGEIQRYARLSFPVGYSGLHRPDLTVRQNIVRTAGLYGANPGEVLHFIETVANLGPALDEEFRRLPREIRQMVCIALSYAIPFETYLVDEHVAAGPPEFRKLCVSMFRNRLAEAGCILATRHVNNARRFGDMGAIIHNGMMALYEDLDEAIADFEELQQHAAETSAADRDPDERYV